MTFEEWWDEQTILCDGRGIAEAGWSAATEAAIPDGYVLAPIDPTEQALEIIKNFRLREIPFQPRNILKLSDESLYRCVIQATQDQAE